MTDYTSWVNQAKASQMTGGLIPHPLAGPMEGGPFHSPMEVALFGRSASSSTSSSSSGSSSAGGGLGAILVLLFIVGAFSGSGDKNKSGASPNSAPPAAVVEAAQPSSSPINLTAGATSNDAADLPTAVMTAAGNLRVKNEEWIMVYRSPSEDDFMVSLPTRDRGIKKIGKTADGWYELEIQTPAGIERGFSKTDVPRQAKTAAPKAAPQPAAPKRTSSASPKRPAPNDLHAANQGSSPATGERTIAADAGGGRR